VARDIEASGAHYLTGAYGAVPGETDAIAGRKVTLLDDLAWPSLAFHAAELNGRRCCGRYEKVHGRRLSSPPTAEPPRDALGEWVRGLRRARDADVITPVVAQATGSRYATRTLIRGFEGNYYPRRHVVNRRDCPGGQGPDICHPNFIYIGESCAGKRHFDCVGFVCCVFTQALGRTVWLGVERWASQGDAVDPGDIQPADIVLWPGHVALVAGWRGDRLQLIHANGDRRGVEMTRADTDRQGFQAIHLRDGFFGG
jgi:cell wall-associated NlpC family hydrolase